MQKRVLYIVQVLLLPLLFTLSIAAQELIRIPDDHLVIRDIVVNGNNITKQKIIERELLFVRGDTIKKMELLPMIKRSRDNLMNTSLFNAVNFDAEHFPENKIDILIEVVERWYIWPVPIFELADRNFSTFLKNREWDRINYGMWLKWNNFRGRNEELLGKIRLGYKEEYSMTYKKPNMGKLQQHGITGGFVLNRQNEISFMTIDNAPVDYKEAEGKSQINRSVVFNYQFRRKHFISHRAGIEYAYTSVSDSVAILNPDYLGNGATSMSFLTLNYRFTHDLRDSKIYPLEGYAFKLDILQKGLGIITDFDHPHTTIFGTFFFHQKLNHRFYFSNATKARYSTRKPLPRVFNKALGYNENLSGYEYYVIDGSDYFLTKYFLKFELVKPTYTTIPFIKMKQFNKIFYAFYINLFADAGYVYNANPDPSNFMSNEWQFSAGIGLDFVTYYDQVFRIEYVLNKYGDKGIFLNIETPFARW